MKEFFIQIVQALVDNSEEVQVNEIEGDKTVVLELRAAKTDMGKIIGKQGKTANARDKILIRYDNTGNSTCIGKITPEPMIDFSEKNWGDGDDVGSKSSILGDSRCR